MLSQTLPACPTPSSQRGSGGGSSKSPKKKRAKKDKNAPKGAMTAFMQFSQAKRAEVSREGNTRCRISIQPVNAIGDILVPPVHIVQGQSYENLLVPRIQQ